MACWMAASLAAADQDSVLVVRFDADETAEVGRIGIDGKDARTDLDTALALCSLIQTGKFIGNS